MLDTISLSIQEQWNEKGSKQIDDHGTRREKWKESRSIRHDEENTAHDDREEIYECILKSQSKETCPEKEKECHPLDHHDTLEVEHTVSDDDGCRSEEIQESKSNDDDPCEHDRPESDDCSCLDEKKYTS